METTTEIKNFAMLKRQIYSEFKALSEEKQYDEIIARYQKYAGKYQERVANSPILCLVSESYTQIDDYEMALKVCNYAMAYCGGREYMPLRELRYKILTKEEN